jgi:hypothetical protein
MSENKIAASKPRQWLQRYLGGEIGFPHSDGNRLRVRASDCTREVAAG